MQLSSVRRLLLNRKSCCRVCNLDVAPFVNDGSYELKKRVQGLAWAIDVVLFDMHRDNVRTDDTRTCFSRV